MSVTMRSNNVVPLSNAVPPAAPAPASPLWPMPMGAMPPGCCPPSNLMQCYCDIQNATAFICAVMIDCINTNPAVAQAMVDAIVKSGSAVPLVGAIDGVPGQPGQVGELVQIVSTLAYPGNGATQSLTVGVLQPGDWDCWAALGFSTALTGYSLILNPSPPGFYGDFESSVLGQLGFDSLTPVVPAIISVPTLINFNLNMTAAAAGTMTMYFRARRVR